MIQIHGIKLHTGESTELLIKKAENRLRIPRGSIVSARITKESVDAREKPLVYRVFSLEIGSEKPDEWLIEACKRTNTQWSAAKSARFEIRALQEHLGAARPVVAGFGPCGMFAALALAEYGLRPVVLERGGCMDERVEAVERFFAGGPLDPECNVQFGEGGAGTFSDGKLTTGTKSPYAEWILERFVDAGASPVILYRQKPHVGTDVLRNVVVNIRKRIEELGGEVRFGCRLEKLDIEDGLCDSRNIRTLKGLWYADRKDPDGLKYLAADSLILALGHSARGTIRNLLDQGLLIEPKPFSMGVRIEHPQDLIDMAQYGALHEELGLGPADYKLSVKTSSGRGVYTFCMCPGGYVINSSSEPGRLVTNGMSNSNRGSGTANAALLADVRPEDYAPQYLPEGTDPKDPLAGMALQEKYEELAFKLGGSSWHAPAQSVGEFLGKAQEAEEGSKNASFSPSFRPGTTPADISACLPDFVADALRQALPLLGKKLNGFDSPDAIMTAIESRSSSPVRIKRDPETLQALPQNLPDGTEYTIKGLYPAGEGAGYAGGIMSAAADGVRIAVKIAGE